MGVRRSPRFRARRGTLGALALIALLAACQTAPSTAPPASSAAGAGPSGSPTAPPPTDLGAAEVKLRNDDRSRAGLVNLGAGASELAGLMDTSASKALQAEVARTQAVIGGQTSEAPGGRLVSDTTAGTAIFAPWTMTTLVYEGLMDNGVSNTRILDDRDTLGPSCVPGFGTCAGDQTPARLPSEDSGTESGTSGPTDEKVTVGGNQGVITTTTTSTVAFDGSKVSIDIEVKVSGEIHDANGTTVYRVDSTGKGHIDGDACPDASGIATAHVSFTASESYVSGGSTSGLEEDFSADVRIRADDDANLAGVEIIAKAHETSSGGVLSAGGGESELLAHELNAGATFKLPNDPVAGFGALESSNETADSTEATNLILGMGIFSVLPAKVAAKAAETAWRSGMCVRVSPKPKGGNVAHDSTTDVRVIVRQRYEDVELDKPVTASLDAGPKSIAPAGQALPAPATFTYTAGPKAGDTGVVTFKSVSNRGIGKTSVTFQVESGWTADRQDGAQALKGQKCGGLGGVWKIVGTIKTDQIDSTTTTTATINGTTLVGTYTYKSVTKSFPSIVTTITASGRASIAAQPDGTLKMTIFGTTATSTAVGAGTQVTVSVPIPDGSYAWIPGGTCP
jgi:hypothetical protein